MVVDIFVWGLLILKTLETHVSDIQ